MLAAPGKYSLCWCRRSSRQNSEHGGGAGAGEGGGQGRPGGGSGDVASDVDSSSTSSCAWSREFRASAGQLLVQGPLATHELTCAAGDRSCRLEKLEGEGLDVGDFFMVSDVCGIGRNVLASKATSSVAITSQEEEAFSSPQQQIGGRSDRAADARRSPAPATARGDGVPGGGKIGIQEQNQVLGVRFPLQGDILPKAYRLCFCHRELSCATPWNFQASIGVLLVRGPLEDQ